MITFEEASARHRSGDIHGALDGYARLACLHADEGLLLHLLGVAFKQIGQPALALKWLRRATAAPGSDALLLHNLGEAAWACGDFPRAERAYLAALQQQPDFGESRTSLALLLREAGAFAAAAREARRAVAITPHRPRAHLADGLTREAANPFARAVAADPSDIAAWTNLGAMHLRDGRWGPAARAARRAIALAPANSEAWVNYGSVLLGLGYPQETVKRQKRGLAIRPTPQLHSNLLFSMLSDPASDDTAMLREARRWQRIFAPTAARRLAAWPNTKDPERPLVIGLVSGDFRRHPVAGNVEDLLHHRDRQRMLVHCYAEIGAPDTVTRRFMAMADRWTPTIGLDDTAVAQAIHGDRVDILVFLGGHTASNRLSLAPHRSAPVQISFHAPSTTGVPGMDYWLTDALLTPPGWEDRFSEKLVRLPTFYTFRRPEAEVAPRDGQGAIVFASFNNPGKINDPVLRAWARILAAVPQARLQLGYQNHFAEPALQRRVFDVLGMDLRTRIDFLPAAPNAAAHLARLAQADIILDTFPFGGATSTFDALWMGVPVVTLAGDRFVGRVGFSLLSTLGIRDLIATDVDDYVTRAVRLADDPARRMELRSSLRHRLERSAFLDHAAQARAFDAALCAIWREWCAA